MKLILPLVGAVMALFSGLGLNSAQAQGLLSVTIEPSVAAPGDDVVFIFRQRNPPGYATNAMIIDDFDEPPGMAIGVPVDVVDADVTYSCEKPEYPLPSISRVSSPSDTTPNFSTIDRDNGFYLLGDCEIRIPATIRPTAPFGSYNASFGPRGSSSGFFSVLTAPEDFADATSVVEVSTRMGLGSIGNNEDVLVETGDILRISTAFASITITDGAPPVITTPDDISQGTDPGLPTASVSLSAVVTDESEGAIASVFSIGTTVITSPHAFPIGTTTVTVNATDASGSVATPVTFDVTVTDAEQPVITQPDNILQASDAGLRTASVALAATVTDNSGEEIAPVFAIGETLITSPHIFPEGVSTVTVSAADSVGNAADLVSFTVTVTDVVDPTVTITGTQSLPDFPIEIVFSEPVSGFVSGDLVADGVDVTAFTNTCGSDPCARFTATLTPQAGAELTYTITVPATVATDASGNDNMVSNVFGAPSSDGVAPVVLITGVPDGFAGPLTATVSFDWGEPVAGFAADDLTVTGGSLGPITGGPQVWTAELRVDGTTDVTVSVADAAVQDVSGTPSVASSVTGVFASVSVAEEVIREFLGARGAALIAAQPGLTGLLDSAGASGNILVTRGAGTVQVRTGSEGPVWAALNSNWSTIDGFETAYTNLSFGTHIYLQDETLLGVMVQFDHAASTEGLSEIEGTGWLIGPYYVARHGGVEVDARLLWGRTNNDISPVGTYRDTFETERVLAMINLSGEIETGAATLRPLFGWSYVDDRSEAYIDALSNPVAAQRVRLSQIEAGLDWTMPVGEAGLEIVGGMAGLFTAETGGNGSIEGARGRVDLGLRRQGIVALEFDLGVYADGLGQSGFEAYGVDLSVDWRF